MRDGERDDDPRGVKKRGSSWRSMRSMSTGNLNLLEVGRKMLDAWSPPRELSPPRKRSRQMGRSNVASFAPMVPSDHRSVAMFRGGIVLLVVLALGFVACTTGSVMNARFHGLLPHGVRRTAETLAQKMQWDVASLASKRTPLPDDIVHDVDDRDEYGLLTFHAQCAALRRSGRDPGWPLRDPSVDTLDGLDRLGFPDATQLCEAMDNLPRTLRVYTHKQGLETRRRYNTARLAPTFNRGYDIEEHIVTHVQRGPFAETNVSRANAFLIPARPYLERVAAFPRDGREAQLAGVREMVNEIKKIDGDAWAAAGEGCGRIMVSAHDTGTFAASEADPIVRQKAVFITANADTTTDAQRLEAEVKWRSDEGDAKFGYRNTESFVSNDKDVAAVCSLSFHLPKDAVASGAMRPVFIADPSKNANTVNAMDERPIEMSFRGTLRGGVRNRIFGHYLHSDTLDLESMRWDLQADGPVSPKRYTSLMRDSKFCLHVRGTRVQSPRLIEGMMFGCVPVILADGYELPMSWLFDWSKFSIRLPEIEYRRLPDVLAQADWSALHDNLRKVLPFFVYHEAPIPGDAFWTTMLQTQRQITRGRACVRGVGAPDDGEMDGVIHSSRGVVHRANNTNDETVKGVWEEVGAKASEGGTRGVASVWSWLFGSWGDGSYLKRRSVGRRMLGHGGTRFAPADAADEDLHVQT